MQFFSIRKKFLLITLVPMVVLTLFAFSNAYNYYTKLDEYKVMLSKLELIKNSSNLIHDIQLERGYGSAYFYENKQNYFRTNFEKQMKEVDKNIKIFQKAKLVKLLPISYEFLNSSQKYMSQISTVRKQLKAKNISENEAFLFYTNFITALSEFVNSLILHSNDEKTTSYILALKKLLVLQELAGQERAFVTYLLNKDNILEKDRYEIRTSVKNQKKVSKHINIILQNTEYKDNLNEINHRYVAQRLQRLLMVPKEWFIFATNKIEDISDLEEHVISGITNNILQKRKSTETLLIIEIFGTILLLLLIYFANRYITKKMIYSIQVLELGVQNFFKFLHFEAEMPEPIITASHDEIGSMAKEINSEMLKIEEDLENDLDFITEATQIVKMMQEGDFTERPMYDPNNPNLKELKEVLNTLMELISEKIQEQTVSLERVNASLEDKVYNQTMELHKQVDIVTKARDEALQAQVMKDEFLANMSHEIRTPLNGILGFVTILKKQIKDEKHLQYINIIDESGKSLLTIINDILDFSKIQSGKFIIDKHPTNSVAIFSNVAILFASKAYEKYLTYAVYIDPKLPQSINLDSTRVKQILSNLLSNAIKFTPLYGEVKVSVIARNNSLVVAVKDSGIGISKENQKKIFSAFTQADGSTTRNYGGTGLGLSISLNLAELMNGTLTLESEEGKGSTFTLTLPMDVLNPEPSAYLNADFSHVRVAILNDCIECSSIMRLIKKYLNDFGIMSIIELDDYQNYGYDILFFAPDEEYNIEIIESKIPAVALLKNDLVKIADIKHIKYLYAPFLPKAIAKVLLNIDLSKTSLSTIMEEEMLQEEEEDIEFEGNILVAEDNKTNQMLIKLILMDYGIDFTMANDGVEAVELYKNAQFDMVLMDENMPNMNGIAAMNTIKEYEKENNLKITPIIALTASALDTDKEHFLSEGMDGFIAKPIENKMLEIEFDKYLKRV